MFNGIVSAIGTVREARRAPGGLRIVVDAGRLGLGDVAVGDSIAVNGTCLTVIARIGRTFRADVSQETLACTAGFAAGGRVNLEKALRVTDRLGGHMVSGHVDGVGSVTRIERSGGNRRLAVAVPKALAKYVARKGSIAVNGVSLTVNEVNGATFTANLIPHTLKATNLGDLREGDKVNLEVDMLARYVERLKANETADKRRYTQIRSMSKPRMRNLSR